MLHKQIFLESKNSIGGNASPECTRTNVCAKWQKQGINAGATPHNNDNISDHNRTSFNTSPVNFVYHFSSQNEGQLLRVTGSNPGSVERRGHLPLRVVIHAFLQQALVTVGVVYCRTLQLADSDDGELHEEKKVGYIDVRVAREAGGGVLPR